MKKIAVTGGAGQIAYNLLFSIANGDLLGEKIHLAIHDLDEKIDHLKGVFMELQDGCFPLLEKITISSNADEIFQDADIVLMVGAKPRTKDMERSDLISENGRIFQKMGKSLNRCSKDVFILVIGNPCNTNCLIALHNAKNIDPSHFFAMTRLDQNRATYQIAKKANVLIHDIEDMIIWGNHSPTMVPDFFNVKIKGESIKNYIDKKWLEEFFIKTIQKRGKEVIRARGKSSAASAAKAIIDAMKALVNKEKKTFSSGIYSYKNPYGIDKDLVFSFPCYHLNGELKIVKGLKFTPFIEKMIKNTEKELIEEREKVFKLGFL